MMARLAFTTLLAALCFAGFLAFPLNLAVTNSSLAAAFAGLAALLLLFPSGRLGLAAALRRHGAAMAAFAVLLTYLALSHSLAAAGPSPGLTGAWYAAAGLGLLWLAGVCLANGVHTRELITAFLIAGIATAIVSLGLGLIERAQSLGGAGLSAFMVLGAFATIDQIRRDHRNAAPEARPAPAKLALPAACYLLTFGAIAAGQMWPAALAGLVGSALAGASLLLRTPAARRQNATKGLAILLAIPCVILVIALSLAWLGASTHIATAAVPAQTMQALRAAWADQPFLGAGLGELAAEIGIADANTGALYLAEAGWIGVCLALVPLILLLVALATAKERRRSPPTGFALALGLTGAIAVLAPFTPDLTSLSHAGAFLALLGIAAAMADPVRRSALRAEPQERANTQRL
jgi:hypothetical protein